MVIECWQTRREVQIVTTLAVFEPTSVLAEVDRVKVGASLGDIDVFEAYNRAKRHPRVRGPHHHFAGLTARNLPNFFRRFGVPRFEGQRELPLGEVLIEAKRLRLLMEAWHLGGHPKPASRGHLKTGQ